jgi:hypothetical protein
MLIGNSLVGAASGSQRQPRRRIKQMRAGDVGTQTDRASGLEVVPLAKHRGDIYTLGIGFSNALFWG